MAGHWPYIPTKTQIGRREGVNKEIRAKKKWKMLMKEERERKNRRKGIKATNGILINLFMIFLTKR
jgi:hypothetical protein